MSKDPVTITPDVMAQICSEIASGRSLRSVCQDEGMPHRITVFKRMNRDPEFLALYNVAVEARSDALVEEILDIADDGRNDWVEQYGPDGEATGWKFNAEHYQRSRLRVDTRKWVAGKMKPKKYGDKLDLTGALTLNNVNQLTDDQLASIAATGSAGAAEPEAGA